MYGHIYMVLLSEYKHLICILQYFYDIVYVDQCIDSFIKCYGCEKEIKEQ